MTLLVAAAVGAVLFVWLLGLETRRKPEIVVYLLLGATLVDAIIYPNQGTVPIGPFRPSIAGQDLRIVDILVPTALGARLLVRGLPRRCTAEGMTWLIFFAWYGFAAVVGWVREQPTELILFQGKFILQTGGVMAVVAGVPIRKLADPVMLRRVAVVVGWPTLLMLPLAAANQRLSVPILPRAQFGDIAPDAATMLFTLGVLTLIGMAATTVRWPQAIGSGAMLATPFVADQRAALLGVVPTLLIIAVAMSGPVWRRRSMLRPGTIVPILALLVLPVGVAAAQAAESGEDLGHAPVLGRLDETFGSEQKQESAEIRIIMLREGRRLADDRPVIGQGLGQQAAILRGTTGDPSRLIADFHNIFVDLAVRCGFSGVLLFLLALTVTFAAALRRWVTLLRNAYACLVLAAAAALSGLIVKGLFETIFQKYRLAVLMGVLLGILAASGSATGRDTQDAEPRRRPQWI